MRLLFKLIVGIILIAGAVIVGLHFYIANGDHRESLEAEASKALGRQVTITEVTNAGLLPNPVFSVTGLQIANADGMSDPYFASVSAADIGVKLMPLILQQNIQIDRFILDEPEVFLEKRANGSVNWILGQSSDTIRNDGQGTGVDERINDISFGNVELRNGKVTYRDQASQQVFVAEQANLAITLTSLDAAMSLDGKMVFQGKPANLSVTLDTPRGLMNNAATSLGLNFNVDDNKVDTRINLKGGGELAYSGALDIDAPSLKSLLAALGMPIAVETGFNNLAISGPVSGTASSMSFENAAITFDNIRTVRGGTEQGVTSIMFDWGGARPKVTGTVDLEQLDLRPYLPEPNEKVKAARESGEGFPPWPTDRIDFSSLQAVDVDLKARTNAILLHDISFDQSGVDLKITNGTLRARLMELNLYGGGGEGVLTVNSRQRSPEIRLENVVLTGMNAQLFATEVLGLKKIRGVGALNANLSARGHSVLDFVQSLNGAGSFDIKEGAMEGVDLGKIVRTANTLVKGFNGTDLRNFDVSALTAAISEARGPASETQFTELDSGFSVTNGIVRAENILLEGPYFVIRGDGTVDLPAQKMTMSFTPTVFETLEDTTGRKLPMPLQITGTFNDPKIGFDTNALLRGAVEDRVRGLLGNRGIELNQGTNVEDALKQKARDELTKRLGLGGSGDEEAGSETDPAKTLEEELTNKALGAIFGGGKKED